jgi:hypothetical protein
MSPDTVRWNRCSLVFLLLAGLSLALAGCKGMAKGVTEAYLEARTTKEDARKCYIRGRPFEGLEPYLTSQVQATADRTAGRHTLKVLMVHGIGSHSPGYSTRLAENLARTFSLDQRQERDRMFSLYSPGALPGRELGVLRVSRYTNRAATREMVFGELTWDPIVEQEKRSIAFDNSDEYAFRRASINNVLKTFVNDTIPDVVMYYGSSRGPIQASVQQALCWLMSKRFQDLPKGGTPYCDVKAPDFLSRIDDDYAFITHSLGSRITTDALQQIASMEDVRSSERAQLFRKKRFTVYMLSNQLPLLQLGWSTPAVSGKIEQICSDRAPRSGDRMVQELRLVAFSDPNDLMSYAITPKYLDTNVDSRLCPTLTNVMLNIAEVKDLFGAGTLANPLEAHTGYENDSRVIALIAQGIGNEWTSQEILSRCTWLEALPEPAAE